MRLRTTILALPLAATAVWAESAAPTYYKDVLPVLQKNCQSCHRPGEAAPMSFMTYESTRPWAKAMKEAVVARRMPPWSADPHVGKFSNDRSLNQAEVATLVNWAESGGKAGEATDAPAQRSFASGWTIPQPDIVYEMSEEYEVAPTGTIEYTYFIIPTGFEEDKWVQMAEARPGNREVVHHIIAFVREPGSKWLRDYPVGKAFIPRGGQGRSEGSSGFLTGYAPGLPPEQLRPGHAKRMKAGSDIVLQMHYTANGKTARDRSKVGIIFAKEPVTHRVMTLGATNNKFVIPAGADNHQVDAAITLYRDSELVGLLPHMHLRGKAFEMSAVYPTGEREKLLWVPKYDFNWQLWYQLPEGKVLPKGTRIEASGWYDNSRNNKHNPDPGKDIRWGDQSWEEMMIGFFNVSIPVDVNPADLVRRPQPNASGGGE